MRERATGAAVTPRAEDGIEMQLVAVLDALQRRSHAAAAVHQRPPPPPAHQRPPPPPPASLWRQQQLQAPPPPSLQEEMRSLDFWRAVFAECLAAVFYVFLACGTTTSANQQPAPTIAIALAIGFGMAAVVHCFSHISGAHVNPAVTVAMLITRNVSLVRAFMYTVAQCGGGIAGAALLYGVMAHVPQGVQLQRSSELGNWQMYAMEVILTFLVVLAYLVSSTAHPLERQAASPLFIGGAYLACSLVSAPTLNPARGLGPSFVMNKWNGIWVCLFGPLSGGMLCGLIYEFIFNPFRPSKKTKDSTDEDISSIHSEEELYDDVDNPSSAKFKVSTYNSLRASDPCRPLPLESAEKSNTASPDGTTTNYCSNITTSTLYSALPCKPDPVEPLYCGTKSLYSKSPIPARSGLNRSQSVYSKIPSSNRDQDGMPRPGPLVPAQSLYPMRFNLNPITTTQNIQNQQNQRSESIYGVRGVSNSVNRGQTGGVYSVIHGNTSGMNNTSLKVGTGLGGGPCSGSNSSSSNRPESIYGAASRRHDSTDSAHGPCQVGNSGNSFGLRTLGSGGSYLSGSKTCTGTRKELHSPKGQHHMLSPIAASVISTPNTLASYHHKRSPNRQY